MQMTVDETTGIDKELIAARHEAAIKAKFGYAVKLLDVLSARSWKPVSQNTTKEPKLHQPPNPQLFILDG
jgi:hypothetical protein